MSTEMITVQVSAHRTDASSSNVHSKQTEITIDTSIAGRMDALNLVELLTVQLSACIIKGIERVAESLGIEYE